MGGIVQQTGGGQCLSFVCQFHYFILGCGEVEAHVVFKVLDFVGPVHFQFHTVVANLTHVQNGILVAGRGREALGNQQIFRLVDVVVDATCQFVAEHAKVETDVFGVGSFPFQTAVFHSP